MKKWLVWLCMGTMVFGLTACGGKGAGDQAAESTPESSVESEVITDTEEVVPEDTVTEESMPEEGTGEGMDVTAGWSAEMEEIKAAVIEAVGADNYFPNMPLDSEMLEGMTGITADMYDDYLAEMPMISTNVDTLLIIKAKDDKVEAVQEALNTYREAKVNDTMQYPMNVGKIQASRIETNGNYVSFVQLGGDTMTAMESGDDAVVEQCLQANEMALEVIAQNVH